MWTIGEGSTTSSCAQRFEAGSAVRDSEPDVDAPQAIRSGASPHDPAWPVPPTRRPRAGVHLSLYMYRERYVCICTPAEHLALAQEYTVTETVSMMRALSHARGKGAVLSARLRRVRVSAKIESHPEILSANLPSQLAAAISAPMPAQSSSAELHSSGGHTGGGAAGGGGGAWVLTGVAARRGCIELVFDLVQVGGDAVPAGARGLLGPAWSCRAAWAPSAARLWPRAARARLCALLCKPVAMRGSPFVLL